MNTIDTKNLKHTQKNNEAGRQKQLQGHRNDQIYKQKDAYEEQEPD